MSFFKLLGSQSLRHGICRATSLYTREARGCSIFDKNRIAVPFSDCAPRLPLTRELSAKLTKGETNAKILVTVIFSNFLGSQSLRHGICRATSLYTREARGCSIFDKNRIAVPFSDCAPRLPLTRELSAKLTKGETNAKILVTVIFSNFLGSQSLRHGVCRATTLYTREARRISHAPRSVFHMAKPYFTHL